MVTIRFDDAAGTPVGLTVVILKPDQFRVVIETGVPLPNLAPSAELDNSAHSDNSGNPT
jgi:hypothetical protein